MNSPGKLMRKGTLKKQGTVGGFDPNQVSDNIFVNQAHLKAMQQDVYSEKPRANLYNVIKKLREGSVSSIQRLIQIKTGRIFTHSTSL